MPNITRVMPNITITQHEVLGRYYYTFDWQGSPHEPIRFSWYDAEAFKDSLPWELEELPSERSLYLREREYIRTDAGYWLTYYRILADWNRLLNCGRGIFCRFIMTLYIWGLADVEDGEIPGWQCVLKRFGLR